MRRYSQQTRILCAVDCIIFGYDGTDLKLLVIQRGFQPFKGKWSLVGGFIKETESAEEAARHILKNLTGLDGIYMEQLHTFTKTDRDTVERTISIAYFALIDIQKYRQQLSEDFHPVWHPINQLPELIFDHTEMVELAKEKLRYKAAQHPLLFELLPDKFTMPQLQNLYECVYNITFDKGNFNRKIISTQLLTKLKDKDKLSSKKGAFYYKVDTKRYNASAHSFLNFIPNHSPLIVAEQFGTLAQLYPNRIDLGLGRAPGTDQQTAHAIRRDFVQASQLFPAELEKIQTYFSARNQPSAVRVPIAEGTGVPVYILGSSTDSAHLAAAKGLPYAFASHFAPAHLHTALRIYKQEFQPSAFLAKPYTMAGVNVLVADTDEQGEQLFTSLIKMFLGVLTGQRKPLQPPAPMTPDIEELFQHPALNQMLRCSFYGSKQTVKKLLQQFLQETEVDELISVSPMYSLDDRLKSVRLFAEIMKEINEG